MTTKITSRELNLMAKPSPDEAKSNITHSPEIHPTILQVYIGDKISYNPIFRSFRLKYPTFYSSVLKFLKLSKVGFDTLEQLLISPTNITKPPSLPAKWQISPIITFYIL